MVQQENTAHLQGLEEPLVFAGCVAVLEELLDVLLGILPVRRLLESIHYH